MTILRLAAALFAVFWGARACSRHKQPLFFKILLFGCASYLLGAIFESCWTLVYETSPHGFHLGYLGYMGAYFFLLSAYYGAIDRLADGGEKEYRGHRLAALLAPGAVFAVAAWNVVTHGFMASLPMLMLAIPGGLAAYFALKHLILPDVFMGIIRVMRPYNACMVLLCLAETLAQSLLSPLALRTAASVVVCVLLVIALPMADRGVQKWYT